MYHINNGRPLYHGLWETSCGLFLPPSNGYAPPLYIGTVPGALLEYMQHQENADLCPACILGQSLPSVPQGPISTLEVLPGKHTEQFPPVTVYRSLQTGKHISMEQAIREKREAYFGNES